MDRDLQTDLETIASLLSAIAHPPRLQIMKRLVQGETSFKDLMAETGLPQAPLSHQLAVLRGLGLASVRHESGFTFSRCDDERAKALINTVLELFPDDASLS